MDRRSHYVVIAPLSDKTAETYARESIRAFRRHGRLPRHTLTADNGKEFMRFKTLEKALGLDVYFVDPYCSNQRATNENINGLIRQFFPKGTDFATIKAADIRRVEHLLNHRPRRCLDYRTPYEVLVERRSVALRI